MNDRNEVMTVYNNTPIVAFCMYGLARHVTLFSSPFTLHTETFASDDYLPQNIVRPQLRPHRNLLPLPRSLLQPRRMHATGVNEHLSSGVVGIRSD